MELIHLLNRGVDKRDIFLEDGDRVRFIHNLYSFNDVTPANNTTRHMNDLRSRSCDRKPLVKLHAWCLMNNHFHLLVSEEIEGGITQFIRKLGVGYAKYFNEKYSRSGTLFQGRTKRVQIERDAHFLHILNYIHLNPLDYLDGSHDWRSRSIQNYEEALAYLDKYRWSSYLDYCGTRNFPSLIETDIYKDVYIDYKSEITSYLMDIEGRSEDLPTLE